MIKITVIIDGVDGYGSSFLEESFGGLIREEGFTIDDLKNKLFIKLDCNPSAFRRYEKDIWRYIEDAWEEKKNS